MTKAELINSIAIQTGYDQVTISQVVESFMATVKKNIIKGEAVYLRGFGTFGTKTRAKKVARNISKQTSIVVPEHRVPSFKPSSFFADAVKGNKID